MHSVEEFTAEELHGGDPLRIFPLRKASLPMTNKQLTTINPLTEEVLAT